MGFGSIPEISTKKKIGFFLFRRPTAIRPPLRAREICLQRVPLLVLLIYFLKFT